MNPSLYLKLINQHLIPLPDLRLLIVVSLNLSCQHGLFEPEIVIISKVFRRSEYLHSTYVYLKDCNTQQCVHTQVVVLNILSLNLNCDSQQHVSAPEMVILTNLYRPLKYHREQIKSSKTKYSLESEWKNAEILCNHVSQCPNLLLFRLNSEWGKS